MSCVSPPADSHKAGPVRAPRGAKIVLATTGTLGDLHPFIAVALRLRELDYEAVVATSGHYRQKIEAEGLRLHAVRPDELQRQRDLGMDGAELTRRLMTASGPESFEFVVKELTLPYLRENFADMMAATEGASLVVTSSFAFGATLAAQKRCLPYVNIVLQPLMFMSACDPPSGLRFDWLRKLNPRLASGLARALIGAMDRKVASWTGSIRELRRELGLPAAKTNPILRGQFSPVGNIGLYSPVMGAVQPDSPPATSIAGFSFYDSETGGARALQPELERFMCSGPKPLVFALGSQAVLNPGRFYLESAEAARRLNKRALLLAGPAAAFQLPEKLPPDIMVTGYAPYSLVFPRAEAIIHHGGIGTAAQALRSGRPQLIVPFWGDQHDNAARIVRAGVARSISLKRYSASVVSDELGRLLGERERIQRAAEVGQIVAREDGAAAAAAAIDSVLRMRLGQPLRGTAAGAVAADQPPRARPDDWGIMANRIR